VWWLLVGGFFVIPLLIGAVSQVQKRRNRPFYPHGADAPYNGPDPAVRPVGFPLEH
jgi:hypothetical protein